MSLHTDHPEFAEILSEAEKTRRAYIEASGKRARGEPPGVVELAAKANYDRAYRRALLIILNRGLEEGHLLAGYRRVETSYLDAIFFYFEPTTAAVDFLERTMLIIHHLGRTTATTTQDLGFSASIVPSLPGMPTITFLAAHVPHDKKWHDLPNNIFSEEIFT